MSRQVVRPGSDPTDGEIAALQAYLDTGSVKLAAHSLGLQEATIKVHLANVRTRLRAKTTAEAVLKLRYRLIA